MAQADSVPTAIRRRSQARPRRPPQNFVLQIGAISSAGRTPGSFMGDDGSAFPRLWREYAR